MLPPRSTARILAALLPLAAGPARPGPGEAAFWKCWQEKVTAPCIADGTHGDAERFEACKRERAKTSCVAEKAAYEKELADVLATDALSLLAASVKRVCLSEAAAAARRQAPASEDEIAASWREALEVRSEYMRACERSGRDVRDCDERANEAERRTRVQYCPR